LCFAFSTSSSSSIGSLQLADYLPLIGWGTSELESLLGRGVAAWLRMATYSISGGPHALLCSTINASPLIIYYTSSSQFNVNLLLTDFGFRLSKIELHTQ